MSTSAHKAAKHFLENETQFHLGVLPTEQSNPKTRLLEQTFSEKTTAGCEMLLSIDRDVASMAHQVMASEPYRQMLESAYQTISNCGRIIFSGCGATGRLSILLESIWRKFFVDLKKNNSELYSRAQNYENCVFSIMTGGDFALVRSVERFEDYAEFGRRQVRDLDINSSDMLIAITEGGETSSVLGSLDEALECGACGFLMFNNPADILARYIERSRKAIEDERVTVLDLYCGPMALAGSTRMQATTSEQLIAGSMLEKILLQILQDITNPAEFAALGYRDFDFAAEFDQMLDKLTSPENIKQIASLIDFEASIYRQNGLVSYFADDFLLDIFTDTTERNPTFMLPPFAAADNPDAAPSWAFVKHPVHSTEDTWPHVLGRSLRCLNWDAVLYKQMNAPQAIIDNPPHVSQSDLLRIKIGNEFDSSRISRQPNVAIAILGSDETKRNDFQAWNDAFGVATVKFQQRKTFVLGEECNNADFYVDFLPPMSALNLIKRLTIKLILNTMSTGAMIKVGRVTGNWMSWVDVSNKKLVDRGIRLISELCSMSYHDACYALHESIAELAEQDFGGRERPSPVQYTIHKYVVSTEVK